LFDTSLYYDGYVVTKYLGTSQTIPNFMYTFVLEGLENELTWLLP